MTNKIPRRVIEKASEILEKNMGMKNKEASKKLAYATLLDCISIIENLGGRVIWDK